jgi:hypothetical protein
MFIGFPMDGELENRDGARGDLSHIPPEWLAEFEAASKRTLEERFRYSFIKTYRPVLDDEPFRSFETTAEYRRWCEENLPSWLGFGPAE